MAATRDRAIWAHAATNGFVLVTKDEDFQRLSLLQGAPPKVIWIGLGNCSTADVEQLLRRRHDEIVQFLRYATIASETIRPANPRDTLRAPTTIKPRMPARFRDDVDRQLD